MSGGAAPSAGARQSHVPQQRRGAAQSATDHPGHGRADQVLRGSGGLQPRVQEGAPVIYLILVS